MTPAAMVLAFATATASGLPAVVSSTALLQVPAQAPDAQTVVRAWLECDECSSGELQAVVNLGEQAVPILSTTLRDGPRKDRLDAHRDHLVKRYRALKEYEKTHQNAAVTQTEDVFVSRYVEKYVALQRTRSARALAAIGGPNARNALDQALKLPLSPEVLKVVRESRARIAR